MDRISSLPDEIICHILSFLPTKSVVATSMLSKRWYPLWRSLPILNISQDSPFTNKDSSSRFIEFVYSILLFRHVTLPIKSFTLRYCYSLYDDPFNVNHHIEDWLTFVFQCGGVEYLHLECPPSYLPKFKTSWCNSLVVLKLLGFQATDVSFLGVELPTLKILHLAFLRFADDRILPDLLSRCPNLEDFKAINCISKSVCSNYSDEDFSDDDEEYLEEEYLKDDNSIEDNWAGIKGLTKLVRAEIDKSSIQFLLETLSNVEHLILDIDKVFPYGYSNHIGTFHNLTYMQLSFAEYRWQWLMDMLKHCPKLQTLILSEEASPNKFRERWEDWICPKFAPECISSKLRECTIYGYKGMQTELQFATYIMQNASVLRNMRICSHLELDSIAKLELKGKLFSCKKLSATCPLSFF